MHYCNVPSLCGNAVVIVRWTPRVVRVFWSKPKLGAWESTVARWSVVLDNCGECSLLFHVARECFGGLMIPCSSAPLSEWLIALAAGILFARASRYGSQIRWSIPRSASTAMIWAISKMLWEDVFCQSKRSMTDCMGQEDIAFSLGFGIHWLLLRAWCAEELQVSYIFYLWGSKCLRLWPWVLSSFVFLFVATRHFLFGSLLFSQFFSSLTCWADVYVFPLSYLCFYADLICCNLLFGPLSLQVVAAIKFTSLDCCMYREACISTGR
jgi:hypothetical protein